MASYGRVPSLVCEIAVQGRLTRKPQHVELERFSFRLILPARPSEDQSSAMIRQSAREPRLQTSGRPRTSHSGRSRGIRSRSLTIPGYPGRASASPRPSEYAGATAEVSISHDRERHGPGVLGRGWIPVGLLGEGPLGCSLRVMCFQNTHRQELRLSRNWVLSGARILIGHWGNGDSTILCPSWLSNAAFGYRCAPTGRTGG